MTRRIARTWAALAFVVGVGFNLLGCASSAQPPRAEVRAVPSEQVEIFWIKVDPVDGGVRANGMVRRAGMSRAVLWGTFTYLRIFQIPVVWSTPTHAGMGISPHACVARPALAPSFVMLPQSTSKA